ncbi:MAG: AAA family ATPase, partial [Halioglobus sp.]
MKLIRASINNFRLLKGLTLDFSCDEDKNLTVVRAANETGKTTCKTALLWGLFGNRALPGEGKKYPLFPSDKKETLRNAEVSVEIEFETDQVVTIGRGHHEIQKKQYRLYRSCIEYPGDGGVVRREAEGVVLFEVKPEGAERILDSDVAGIIESSIPEALKDVYFTDGDSAMSFIEAAATQGVKRKRVSGAIEALLGLDILKKTIDHLGKSATKFSSMIDDTDYAKELETHNDRIAGFEEDVELWEEERSALEVEIGEGSSMLASTRKKIEDALKLGDKAKLVADMSKCVRDIERSKDGSKRALEDMSGLLNSAHLSAAMITGPAKSGMQLLNSMSDNKQLPKVNIPILEELLDRDNCFCGADLSIESEEGQSARSSILKSIEDSRASDAQQEAATSLFYSVRSEQFDESRAETWMHGYASRNQDYSEFMSALSSDQKRLLKLKAERDAIDDTSLTQLRELESSLSSKLDSARVQQGQRESSIEDAAQRKREAEEHRQKIEKRLNKTDTSADKLSLARMTQTVFKQVGDRLVKEELRKVSDEMNRIFLEMIGADPEANDLTLITKAELTEDYDILVYGPNGHQLNPDQDLNGASRRAITLAFILALTKVSQVEAPNVIDTPLGMMAGYVKRSVLRRTVSEGSQVILFLTHDEISGVETIIDETAGK